VGARGATRGGDDGSASDDAGTSGESASGDSGTSTGRGDGGSPSAGTANTRRGGAGSGTGGSTDGGAANGGNADESAGTSSGTPSGGASNGGTAGTSVGGSSGGTSGSGGSSGSSAAGSGGAGLEAGACAPATGVRLEAYGGPANANTISGAIQFYSDSTSMPMDQITVRYFITNEESSAWMFTPLTSLMVKANATQPNLPVQSVFNTLATPLFGADSYFDFTYQTSVQLAPGDQAYLRFEIKPANLNPPNQSNSNDYSYAMSGPFYSFNRILVLRNGALVWGCVPSVL